MSRWVLPLLLISRLCFSGEIDAAKKRWEASPHGPLLERILPPTFEPAQLPQPGSRGAELTLRYCVQCHSLPNPAMHDAAKWPPIVERMVLRMQGRGNMGALMADMMAGVKAPGRAQSAILIAYLKKNSQRALDPARYPEVDSAAGEAFRIACNQCHTLPDPKRHTAAEWRTVVARMQQNMEWMNRVVGSKPTTGEPQPRIEQINAFLAKYARKGPNASTRSGN